MIDLQHTVLPWHGITNKMKTQVILLYYQMSFLSLKNFLIHIIHHL